MSNHFGSFIRQRRRELGLTLMQLSAKIGHSHAYLRDVEVGRRRPFRAHVLPILACALDCDIDELKKMSALDADTLEIPLSSRIGPVALALFERRDSLDNEQLRKILEIIS